MEQYRDRFKYIVVGVLAVLSFMVAYSSFHSGYYPVITRAQSDILSGEKYAPVESESNPYAPYLVGFNELIDRGVSRDEIRYIDDVITNFTLYNRNIYNSKVSYVKNSFERDYKKSLATTYRFRFGINDSQIHKATVTANTLDKKISIKIMDTNDKVLFSRNFDILLNSNGD